MTIETLAMKRRMLKSLGDDCTLTNSDVFKAIPGSNVNMIADGGSPLDVQNQDYQFTTILEVIKENNLKRGDVFSIENGTVFRINVMTPDATGWVIMQTDWMSNVRSE